MCWTPWGRLLRNACVQRRSNTHDPICQPGIEYAGRHIATIRHSNWRIDGTTGALLLIADTRKLTVFTAHVGLATAGSLDITIGVCWLHGGAVRSRVHANLLKSHAARVCVPPPWMAVVVLCDCVHVMITVGAGTIPDAAVMENMMFAVAEVARCCDPDGCAESRG